MSHSLRIEFSYDSQELTGHRNFMFNIDATKFQASHHNSYS